MPEHTPEIEAKFRVDAFDAVRLRCEQAGGEYVGALLQTDRFYDTPEGRLLAGDSGLRVRREATLEGEPGPCAESQVLLTFKGPLRNDSVLKVREEIELPLPGDERMERILAGLGLELVLAFQKRRIRYRLGGCMIELDELPLLGKFAEIEGPSESDVHRVCEMLDLSGPSLRVGYARMMGQICRERGIVPPDVTFDRFGGL